MTVATAKDTQSEMFDAAKGKGRRTPEVSGRVGRGRSKIDRYNWIRHDQPGEFKMIHKDSIEVDPTYQRELRPSTVGVVSREFSWAAFGALHVARRRTPEGERFFVFDGQNRLAGVKRREDITEVPCMVFDVNLLDEEADAFLRTNTNRRPVTALEKHKAKTVKKDPHALAVEELISEAGLRVSSAAVPGTVRCVGLVEKLVAQDEATMRKVWPIIVEVCEGKPIHERIVAALFYIADKTEGEIFKVFWRRKLVEVGYDELLRAAGNAAAFYSKGGPRVWASGMVQLLNRGMKKNRLTLPNDELAAG